MSNTLPELCQWFWDAEASMDLLQQQEQGVFWWGLIRSPLQHILMEHTGLFGAPHPLLKDTPVRNAKKLGRLMKDCLLRNPFLQSRRYEYIVMPHTRQRGGVDIYSDAILSHLPHSQTLVLYERATGQHYPHSKTMALALLHNAFFARNKRLSSPTIMVIRALEQSITENFGLTLNMQQMVKKAITRFCVLQRYYQRLFTRAQARHLYVVVAYRHCAAIAAAQQSGMVVTELQHGIFTPYHLGYSYPIQPEHAPYQPQHIACFGAFYPETTPLSPKIKWHVSGAAYMATPEITAIKSNKQPDSIIFASQAAIANELWQFAVETARLLPNKHCVFHPHPSEDLRSYRHLTSDKFPGNLHLANTNTATLQAMAQSEVVVGVSSTSLLEALALGCKVMVVKLPGHEYMQPVIDKRDAFLVATAEEFCAALAHATPCNTPEYYFADTTTEPIPIT